MNSKVVKFVSPVTNIVDNMVDSSLNLTDKVIPSIKTKTYQKLGEEVSLPYTFTKKYTKQATKATINTGNNYVYKPTHNQILKFRKFYNEKIIDTKGKPLVRGTLDPIISPINKLIENTTHKYLPKGENVPIDKFSCQFDRSFALGWDIIVRSIPVINGEISKTVMRPCNYIGYSNSVYNKHLNNQTDLSLKNSFVATKNATSELEREILQYISSIPPFKILKRNKKKIPMVLASPTLAEDEQEVHIYPINPIPQTSDNDSSMVNNADRKSAV